MFTFIISTNELQLTTVSVLDDIAGLALLDVEAPVLLSARLTTISCLGADLAEYHAIKVCFIVALIASNHFDHLNCSWRNPLLCDQR